MFDVHVRALADRIDGLRLTLFAFARIHNGLVEGAGVGPFRYGNFEQRTNCAYLSKIKLTNQTQGTVFAGSSFDRAGRCYAPRRLEPFEVKVNLDQAAFTQSLGFC